MAEDIRPRRGGGSTSSRSRGGALDIAAGDSCAPRLQPAWRGLRGLAGAVLLAGCASQAPAAPPRPPATGAFDYHLHQVFVPATVNGVPVGAALIDTGANACAVDRALAAELGLGPGRPSTVHGTAGSVQAETVELGSLAVFGAEVAGVAATVYDLGHGATPSGAPLGLIIGTPFLERFAVELDYAACRLTLHRSPVRSGRSAPMALDEGIPLVHLALNGGPPTPFRIDTGASLFDTDEVYLNITRTVADELHRGGQDPRPVQTFSGTGVGGPVELPVLQLESAELAGRVLPAPYAITQPAAGIFADPATPGFIANYTLDGLGRVVLDYLDATIDLPDPSR